MAARNHDKSERMAWNDVLQKLGLTANEAKIYELLLHKGEIKARDLVEDSGLSRGNVYNTLMSLTHRGLLAVTEGKQQHYRVSDPMKLLGLVDEQKQNIERLDDEFKKVLPRLTSAFALSTGRPTVQVYEGKEGFAQALMQSLQTEGEILTYSVPDVLPRELQKINEKYVAQRLRKKIAKRLLLPDVPLAKAWMAYEPKRYTACRVLPSFPHLPGVVVDIYDHCVSYLSFHEHQPLSVVITDRYIAQLHREQFVYLWEHCSK